MLLKNATLGRISFPLRLGDNHWERIREHFPEEHIPEGRAGRKPYDVILMFKVPVLQPLYNLADEQIEYQIRDPHSYWRFLGLTPEGRVPDVRTIWVYREALKALGLVEELFKQLNAQIHAAGYLPRQGEIVDASMVSAPRQRNSREDNTKLKQGEVPAEWDEKPAMCRQQDVDARWTKKSWPDVLRLQEPHQYRQGA